MFGGLAKGVRDGAQERWVFAMRKWNISKTKRSLKISKAKMTGDFSWGEGKSRTFARAPAGYRRLYSILRNISGSFSVEKEQK